MHSADNVFGVTNGSLYSSAVITGGRGSALSSLPEEE